MCHTELVEVHGGSQQQVAQSKTIIKLNNMNKKQASEALANGHAITHNTCLPGGYYHPKSVKVVTEVDGKVKETEATQVFDELNQCLGKPETFFRMKGLQMHETGWSISTTKDFNPITKQSKKNGKAAK